MECKSIIAMMTSSAAAPLVFLLTSLIRANDPFLNLIHQNPDDHDQLLTDECIYFHRCLYLYLCILILTNECWVTRTLLISTAHQDWDQDHPSPFTVIIITSNNFVFKSNQHIKSMTKITHRVMINYYHDREHLSCVH